MFHAEVMDVVKKSIFVFHNSGFVKISEMSEDSSGGGGSSVAFSFSGVGSSVVFGSGSSTDFVAPDMVVVVVVVVVVSLNFGVIFSEFSGRISSATDGLSGCVGSGGVSVFGIPEVSESGERSEGRTVSDFS